MTTDDLIRALSADVVPGPPVTDGLWPRLGLALGLCIGLVGVTLGFRADLGVVLLTPVSALRFALALALFGAGLDLSLRLTRPDGIARDGLWPLATAGCVAGLAVVWALATTPAPDWGRAAIGTTLVWCLTSIPVLSVVPVTALMVMVRRGAPRSPGMLGAGVGLAGSSAAAAVYALHCIEDSPLFYVPWYGLSIAVVTLISALIGRRFLRW